MRKAGEFTREVWSQLPVYERSIIQAAIPLTAARVGVQAADQADNPDGMDWTEALLNGAILAGTGDAGRAVGSYVAGRIDPTINLEQTSRRQANRAARRDIINRSQIARAEGAPRWQTSLQAPIHEMFDKQTRLHEIRNSDSYRNAIADLDAAEMADRPGLNFDQARTRRVNRANRRQLIGRILGSTAGIAASAPIILNDEIDMGTASAGALLGAGVTTAALLGARRIS